MPDDTRHLLHAASPQPAVPDDFDLVWVRARRQRRVRQLAVALGAVGVVAVAVVVLPGMLQRGTPGSLEIVGEPDQPGWPDVRGMTWRVPLDTIPQGVTAGVVEDRRVFFVRDGDTVEVLLAAAQHLPNEGLWWCPDEQLFASPAHGELFDRNGRARFGPAGRDLDRLAAEVRTGVLLVDPASVVPGGPAEPANTISHVLPTGQARAYEQAWAGDGFCAGHQPDHDPPSVLDPDQPAAPAPDSALPVEVDDVPQHLREVFVPDTPVVAIAVDPTGSSDRQVFATPQTEPPLLFGTSCDLVSAVPLPAGWLGYCLERTHAGQRISSLFPWGTTSTSPTSKSMFPTSSDARSARPDRSLAVSTSRGRPPSGSTKVEPGRTPTARTRSWSLRHLRPPRWSVQARSWGCVPR